MKWTERVTALFCIAALLLFALAWTAQGGW